MVIETGIDHISNLWLKIVIETGINWSWVGVKVSESWGAPIHLLYCLIGLQGWPKWCVVNCQLTHDKSFWNCQTFAATFYLNKIPFCCTAEWRLANHRMKNEVCSNIGVFNNYYRHVWIVFMVNVVYPQVLRHLPSYIPIALHYLFIISGIV